MTPGAGFVERIRLSHILLLALALRLVSLAIPAMAHPDEIFQYLEPAHRLVFGRGVITWEWRAGMRSWLIPLVVAGPMALGGWVAPGGGLYLVLPKLVMTLASLVIVIVAWRLGARLSRLHAVFAAAVAATWYEFVFFAPHILSDTIAVILLLPAALILVQRAAWSDRRLIVAGLLLGLAALARFQLLPAIATLAVASCGTRLRDGWRPLMIGGVAGLLPGIACDLATHQMPFGWLAENIRLNLLEGRAAAFGASGPLGFVPMLLLRWSFWWIPILILAGIGARRYPALAWTAAINLGFHMLITHKEYRFILLSVTLAILLAAIGSIDWIQRVAETRGTGSARRRLVILSLGWLATSAGIAFSVFRTQWVANQPYLALYAGLRADPELCGIMLYRQDFSRTGGYAYLHRDVPMHWIPNELHENLPALLARWGPPLNTILAMPSIATELPPGYAQQDCRGNGDERVCTYRRPGGCRTDPHAPTDVNAMLRRMGA